MSLSKVSLYWHTLKYLKPVQFYGRLRFRFWRPRPDLSSAPPLRRLDAVAHAPARRRPSMLGPQAFRLLNEDGDLFRGWDDVQRAKLWRYNLHYFDDLNALDAGSRNTWHTALMDHWIRSNPPGSGTGWEPYPTSLRICNWIKRHLDGRPLNQPQAQSLAVQVRWLSQRLEWHLLGNHLFANGKALVLAGLAFEGAEADRWLTKGLAIVRRELPEQVLSDGGGFERSPMYHALLLEDVLDLVNASQAYLGRVDSAVVELWKRKASGMLDWLKAMCHPDGEISFFNDAAFGIAPTPAELVAYARRVGVTEQVAPNKQDSKLTVLRESGYVRVECGPAVALLDVAPIGPDYLPGHAHADTLSFELSVHGQRVVVNGGTSRYGLDAVRLRERGTAAHSTVSVDGQDSSEVWSGFRVARRARPFQLTTASEGAETIVVCAHDGYRRLKGRPIHRREWRVRSGILEVQDEIWGRFDRAEARYHFHPGVAVTAEGDTSLTLTLPGGQHLRLNAARGSLRIEPSRYACEFGQVQETACAIVSAADGGARVVFTWT